MLLYKDISACTLYTYKYICIYSLVCVRLYCYICGWQLSFQYLFEYFQNEAKSSGWWISIVCPITGRFWSTLHVTSLRLRWMLGFSPANLGKVYSLCVSGWSHSLSEEIRALLKNPWNQFDHLTLYQCQLRDRMGRIDLQEVSNWERKPFFWGFEICDSKLLNSSFGAMLFVAFLQ